MVPRLRWRRGDIACVGVDFYDRVHLRPDSFVASRRFAVASLAEPGDTSFGRTSVYVQSAFRVEVGGHVSAAAFLPVGRRSAVLVRLTRRSDRSRLSRFADALGSRADLRVRDLAAKWRVDVHSLGVRSQARLQQLTNAEVGTIAARLVDETR